MPVEIERRFLIDPKQLPQSLLVDGNHLVQGYLTSGVDLQVRVRTAGDKGILTIKGKQHQGVTPEYEYEIPLQDAQELLPLCSNYLIRKTRYRYDFERHCFEIDVFKAENAGLVIVEVELQQTNEEVSLPAFLQSAREISGDFRYSNASLSKTPYSEFGR